MNHLETISNKDFLFVKNLAYKKTGIVIDDCKREMVCRRLSKRVRDLNIIDIKNYCNMLRQDDGGELVNFINAVTTNLTSFFRERHHFDYLASEFFNDTLVSENKRVRIWSSACSTGEEAYSLAMTMLDALGQNIDNLDIKILATDLDTQVIKTAKSGIYSLDRIKDLPSSVVNKWFRHQDPSDDKSNVLVDSQLKHYITFNKLNLLGDWPMKGRFDVILCRNVLIYFDRPTQLSLIDRFYQLLSPKGILILGHSESVLKDSDCFDSIGNTIYIKK